MTRRRIVAGNWKMNLSFDEAKLLAKTVNTFQLDAAAEIFLFPSALYLESCLSASPELIIGAQNGYPKDAGAFTGEISMAQLRSMKVRAVLIGHSERRELFHESNELLKDKLNAALSHGLTPFFCCGEPLEIREAGNYLAYVKEQLEASVFHLNEEEIVKVVFAYEPIWAIGTGKTASVAEAEEMHAAIRSWFSERYSEQVSQSISILYGGSCNPSNAQALFACPNVDGGLIGGAALKADDFKQLVAKQTWTI